MYCFAEHDPPIRCHPLIIQEPFNHPWIDDPVHNGRPTRSWHASDFQPSYRVAVRRSVCEKIQAEQEGQQLKTNGDKGQQQPNVKNEGAQGAIDERHQQRRAKAITREAAPQLCGLRQYGSSASTTSSIDDSQQTADLQHQQQGAELMTSARKRNLTSK
eukprot:CAMPEP_0181217346 /NCGR_PEP_ID=MMETSP1096-20121128/27100_1 /TAXON_ID=156174 ORGANISM="Chrysochromulina ericina, Strain CCMP281" /NCGR_SAMPLE_ID=MMETSP1096 /ASSEMBLY_ACC=CAM_ASM_000453 /LENGTH=158 /DNA_ID=CAMNT_0023309467 /DNA_START=356 /DNA_END=833 /DNA_ORIENTATION=+